MYNEQNNYGVPVQSGEVSVKEWLGTMLLLCIPVVNLVLMFVWAFGSNVKPSKANYFKAQLIFALIIVVIQVIIFTLFGATILAMIAGSSGW